MGSYKTSKVDDKKTLDLDLGGLENPSNIGPMNRWIIEVAWPWLSIFMFFCQLLAYGAMGHEKTGTLDSYVMDISSFLLVLAVLALLMDKVEGLTLEGKKFRERLLWFLVSLNLVVHLGFRGSRELFGEHDGLKILFLTLLIGWFAVFFGPVLLAVFFGPLWCLSEFIYHRYFASKKQCNNDDSETVLTEIVLNPEP